jgi:hypothetical protein
MWRKLSVALLSFVVLPSAAPSQEWAQKMFGVTHHDFGSVAKSAKAEYEFEVTNCWVEDVHIAGVRSSCGCTTPRVEGADLKTWEKGKIVAHFNTDRFSGRKGATLTVTIDRPFYAEVQLRVDGFIRDDIAFNPTSVEFGTVDSGKAFEQLVNIGYGGYGEWQIRDVRSGNPHLTGKVVELSRQPGQVLYQLTVQLDNKAPEGYFRDHLMLVGSDNQETPILVEGRVESQITASPGSLMMGVVQPGHKTSKPIVLKGKEPFRVVSITCPDGSFKFTPDTKAKQLHVIPVTFEAGKQTGKIRQAIRIQTDQGKVVEIAAYAVVANPVASTSTEP